MRTWDVVEGNLHDSTGCQSLPIYYGVIDLYHQRSVRKSAYGETTFLRKCDFHFGIWQASSFCSFDASNVYPDGFLKKGLFKSDELSLALDLRSSPRNSSEDVHALEVNLGLLYLSAKVHRGPGVRLESSFTLSR